MKHPLPAIAFSAFALCSCSNLKKVSAIDHLKPCAAADGPTDAYCGTLDVWEDRDAKAGRKIALKIVVLPALKQDYAPDPLFFLAGGPGQGAAELAPDIKDAFQRIQTDRDVVFVDQRGTGKSNPLECKSREDEDQRKDENDISKALLDQIPICLASYKGKADLTKYTTPIAMDDLDDVRRFLGYSKIDLYGGSYGTRAAIVYARRHPDSTRAVILDAVAPPDMSIPLFMARDSQHSLDLLFDDCERDPGCAKRFPNLRDRFKALLARLDAHPQHIHYTDPRTGVEKDLDVRRVALASLLFASLYSPTTASLVPLLIDEADKGDYKGFFALNAISDSVGSNMSMGMQFSVLCAEDAPRIDRTTIDRDTAGTFLGPEITGLRLKACAIWPHATMDPDYYINKPSDIPALILSGGLDPVTPPVWGQEIAAQWKNARHVIVPASAHGAWNHGCVMQLMSQFLNEGSAEKLDTSCVEHIKRPPFFLGPSGPDPLGGLQK